MTVPKEVVSVRPETSPHAPSRVWPRRDTKRAVDEFDRSRCGPSRPGPTPAVGESFSRQPAGDPGSAIPIGEPEEIRWDEAFPGHEEWDRQYGYQISAVMAVPVSSRQSRSALFKGKGSSPLGTWMANPDALSTMGPVEKCSTDPSS
jgi:hypothetical protein